MSIELTTETGTEVTIYADESGALTMTRFGHISGYDDENMLSGNGNGEHVPADYAIESFVDSGN